MENEIRVAVVGDEQVPFHDPVALRLARKIVRDFQPHKVVDLGDTADFPDLTLKFTRKPAFANQVRGVRQSVRSVIGGYRDAAPDAEFIWLAGNHEERLSNYILNRAPEFAELMEEGEALYVPEYLKVADLVDEYVHPYGATYVQRFGGGGKFLFRHGNKTSAAGELSQAQKCGISGHLHRFDESFHNGFDSIKGWWVNGALCNIKGPDVPPSYTGGADLRNWQQGITLITFSTDVKMFGVEQVVFAGRNAMWRGKVYNDRGGK